MILIDLTFKIILDSISLISIDIILKKDGEVLLGKRVNKPAKSYFFSTVDRIKKNKAITNAIKRIA